MLSSSQTPLSARVAYVLVSLVVIVYGMSVLQEILVLLAFSFLLAMLLYPLCHRLERWIPRLAAIFVCLFVLIGVLVLMVYLVSAQLASFSAEFPVFQQKIEGVVDKIQGMVSQQLHLSRTRQVSELKKMTTDLLKNSGSYISTAFSTTTNTLADLSLIPIFVFFILQYRDFFRHFFYRVFGRLRKAKIDDVLRKIYAVVQGYLAGLMLVIAIVATLNSVGLLLLGIDYAIFFGTLAAFLLLIPYIGIMIGSLLPIVYALVTKDSPVYAVGVASVFLSVQFLEGNFITPHIVGSKVSVNPLAAMVALILGGQLWGIAGLVLALPLTAILKVVFDNVEPMKPYGYLLGEAEHTERKKPKRKISIRLKRKAQ
ncbi:MAG: AI-2E family transporter [Spirosomataceae bacterium]